MTKLLSINPATEEVMAEFDYLSDKKAIEELKKSRNMFSDWSMLDSIARSDLLKKAAQVLKKNSKKYGELISLEMGKPIAQSISEVEKCAWACEYYSENAGKFLQDNVVKTEAKKTYIMFQPLGTILGIMPWNFPFWQVFRFACSTIAAGNSVVVKHSSNVPQCAIAIEEVFREAGFPDYVYKNLLISSDTVRKLVDLNLVDGISLTGSTEAGSKIGELGGRNIKKVVLELGGSDPFIVLDDADLTKSIELAITARFQNAGQSCIAAKRFIIHEAVSEEFKEKFVAGVNKLIIGDPTDPKTNIGPLARDDLRENLESQLKMSLKEGAKLLTGGNRPSRKGYFFEPTVIEAKKDSNIVTREETFGPLATVVIGNSDEELLKIANCTQYGLGSSVWCSDTERAERFARRLESGMVVVNGMVRSDPRIPFGGVKKSGLGRELSSYGIHEFVNIKSVVIN